MSRILLTGAAGVLGMMLRDKLSGWQDTLRVSDIADLGEARPGEELVQCDLSDLESVKKLVEGCDGIIHLGGISIEDTFENILNSNIRGTYNLYEAARQKGVSRILFASSNHAIGFHERETQLDANSPLRPDTLYGLSKGYGELLARYYYDKFDIETAAVRIGSCFPKPVSRRMLTTWLSYDDFSGLVKQIFKINRLGYAVVYGASANEEKWWDNHLTAYIGWEPKDSANVYENDDAVVNDTPDRNDPAVRFMGGPFAAAGHFED